MVNFNGIIFPSENLMLSSQNRAFKYGDAIFDTLKYEDGCSISGRSLFQTNVIFKNATNENSNEFYIELLSGGNFKNRKG